MAELVAYNPESRRKSYLKMREKALAYSSEYNLKRKFGLSQDQYQELLDKQNGVCAICKKECTRKLAVDHAHSSGKVRGLLCNKCNRGIGYLQDNPILCYRAAEYLGY